MKSEHEIEALLKQINREIDEMDNIRIGHDWKRGYRQALRDILSDDG